MKSPTPIDGVLGRGVYGASEALRLINFRRQFEASTRTISRQAIARWLRGYDYVRDGVKRQLSFQTEVTSHRKFGQIS
jgi:hypothetical protein